MPLAVGRPDIVVEVISPSSLRTDRIVKLGYYLALKVPEYRLIHPEQRTFERFVYTKKGYVLAQTLEGEATFAPKELRGLKIPLGELWMPTTKTTQRARGKK